jgi:hypothetical protein
MLSDATEQAQADIIGGLGDPSMDVDRWELIISPDEYLHRFKDTLAEVQLINRAPLRKLHTTYHRGPGFDKWLLLAESIHQLWISPGYKDRFFQHLNQYQTAQPGKFQLQASTGRATIPTAVFIHCLSRAGCDAIRLKAYGQKMPIHRMFLKTEPAQADHRWAAHNEWDIGKTYPSNDIWLWGSPGGKQKGMERYPMLVPSSLDYGSVNVKLNRYGQDYSIKIYPRLVHVIKSFNSHLQGGIPRTLHGVRTQLQSALRMIHSLTGKDAHSLGGFRIEVTVKAMTLKEATAKVEKTGFLDPTFWLQKGQRSLSPYQLSTRFIPREQLLANANWVYQQAHNAKLFLGHDSDQPSKRQIQALTDILNALGWNSGLRRPTRSLDRTAWWNEGPGDLGQDLFQVISRQYQTDEEISMLFNKARQLGGTIPCKAHPNNRSHRYQLNNRSPFRIRCCVVGCYNRLQRSAIIHWIAQLAYDNWIHEEALLDNEQ